MCFFNWKRICLEHLCDSSQRAAQLSNNVRLAQLHVSCIFVFVIYYCLGWIRFMSGAVWFLSLYVLSNSIIFSIWPTFIYLHLIYKKLEPLQSTSFLKIIFHWVSVSHSVSTINGTVSWTIKIWNGLYDNTEHLTNLCIQFVCVNQLFIQITEYVSPSFPVCFVPNNYSLQWIKIKESTQIA